MQRIGGKTIVLTKGDTFKATVVMKTEDGTEYAPESGDVVRFAMKQGYEDEQLLVEKVIPNDTLLLKLDPIDTKNLEVGEYVYDIEITYANGDVDTFIDRGTLKLTEEVEGSAPVQIPTGGEYESGEWTPSQSTYTGSIPLQNEHDSPPVFYAIMRKSEIREVTDRKCYNFTFINYNALFGHPGWVEIDYRLYGLREYEVGDSDADLISNEYSYLFTERALSQMATSTELIPDLGNEYYMWDSNDVYQWYAIWMPEGE